MSTPEFVPNQAREESSLVRGITRGLPLVSRVSLTLMTALLAAADHQSAHSQVINNSSQPDSSHTLVLPSTEDTGVGPDYYDSYTDELGNKVVWQTVTGTNGIPPNNPNHRIDTTYVSINGSNTTPSQTAESSLPSDTNSIVTDGHKADPSVNKVYKAISIFRNSTGGGTIFPYIEIYLDAKDVVDHAKRKIIDDLPKGGIRIEQGQGFTYFKVGSDDAGRFIKFGIEGSKDRSEDGHYIIRRDSNGLPIDGTLKMSRRAFLSIVGNSFSGK